MHRKLQRLINLELSKIPDSDNPHRYVLTDNEQKEYDKIIKELDNILNEVEYLENVESMVTEEEYEVAVDIIREYKKQMQEERNEHMKKRLKEYNNTFWYYNLPTKEVYVSVLALENSYRRTTFVKNTNGIIEIKIDHKTKEDLEAFLSDLEEYAPEEYDLERGREEFAFKEIDKKSFIEFVQGISDAAKISEDISFFIGEVKG